MSAADAFVKSALTPSLSFLQPTVYAALILLQDNALLYKFLCRIKTVVKSQYAVKHYVLKKYSDRFNICISCNTKWLTVNIYSCLSFKTVHATCIILNHLPTSAFYWQHTVCAPVCCCRVSQQSLSLSWCFLQWHPESHIIRKIILPVYLNTSCVFFFSLPQLESV